MQLNVERMHREAIWRFERKENGNKGDQGRRPEFAVSLNGLTIYFFSSLSLIPHPQPHPIPQPLKSRSGQRSKNVDSSKTYPSLLALVQEEAIELLTLRVWNSSFFFQPLTPVLVPKQSCETMASAAKKCRAIPREGNLPLQLVEL